jgi:hypothetical protein
LSPKPPDALIVGSQGLDVEPLHGPEKLPAWIVGSSAASTWSKRPGWSIVAGPGPAREADPRPPRVDRCAGGQILHVAPLHGRPVRMATATTAAGLVDHQGLAVKQIHGRPASIGAPADRSSTWRRHRGRARHRRQLGPSRSCA